MSEKLSCAVIGAKSSVFGFTAVGFEVFYADDAHSCEKTLNQLVSSQAYAVIYITETLAEKISAKLEDYSSLPLPAIIPIPDKGANGFGIKNIKKSVERAVGSDILFKDK
ncbi:MAG: V-type ATP synthase subunit F [Ruminococcaceae bacterium]|nr:V-type ATP synthase subunit F [Oscillospiraceae bacterium]